MAETKKYRINRVLEDGVQVVHPETDATQVLFGTDSTVQAELTEVRSLAEGRARSVSYITKAAMELALSEAAEGDFKVGDNIFIEATDVPDYWVSEVYTTKQTTNEAQGIYGYYKVSILETQKVDLTPYQPKTDNSLGTTAKTVVGAINEVHDEIDDIKDGTTTVKNATNATNAANATKLNNKAASEYALKTDVPAEAVFVVTFDFDYTGKTCTSNKTYAEIQQAISNGKIVYGKDSDGWAYQLTSIDCDSTLEFSRIGAEGVGLSGCVIYLDGEDDPWFKAVRAIEKVEDTGTGVIISEIKKKSDTDGTISVTRRAMTNADLPDVSNLEPGDYSVVTVNQKGIVTAGQHLIEWGEAGQTEPSENLAAGGLFFELVN